MLYPPDGEEPLGTDSERLTFRYAKMLPLGIWTSLPGWDDQLVEQKTALVEAAKAAKMAGDPAADYFWQKKLEALNLASRKYRVGHPLYFPRKELIYQLGFVNNPIPMAFLRAPFLHNGSVPTMAPF